MGESGAATVIRAVAIGEEFLARGFWHA